MGKSRCWGELLEGVHGLIFRRLRGGIRKVGRVMGGLFKVVVVVVVVADQWRLLFSRPLEILRQKHADEYGECHRRYGSGAPAGGRVAPWGRRGSRGRTVWA